MSGFNSIGRVGHIGSLFPYKFFPIAGPRHLGRNRNHDIHETCPSVTFYLMKISFSDISRKWILPNMMPRVNSHQR